MLNEKRLIDANALMKYINETHSYAGLPMAAHICTMELLTYAPTVDAVEVVHGRFVDGECTICGWLGDCVDTPYYNYCPNCGAKMDGDGNG
jgi:hypothetical protein